MKKKIKELTYNECESICEKDASFCDECPLESDQCYALYMKLKEYFEEHKHLLEVEVEVDDSKNN